MQARKALMRFGWVQSTEVYQHGRASKPFGFAQRRAGCARVRQLFKEPTEVVVRISAIKLETTESRP